MKIRKLQDSSFEARDNENLEYIYDEFAETYDQIAFPYVSPTVMIGLVCRYLQPDSKILDAGVGTGMVGKILQVLGYKYLHGIDLSPGMLQKAHEKNAYQYLKRMILGEHLDFVSGCFDAAICVGTFTEKHAPPTSLDELVRVVRKDGIVMFSTRTDVDLGFMRRQKSIEKSGKWMLIEKTNTFKSLPYSHPDMLLNIFVYRIL
jgi:predicted TPR repeat methyltransferase